MKGAGREGLNARPYVILNAAMSLDGKIATISRDSKLSSTEDLKRVHRLRAAVDGIMVGIGTVLADDPKLTVKLARGSNPQRIIADSVARTPLKAQVVRTAKQTPTIIGVGSHAPEHRVKALERAGVIVHRCGRGARVSLPILLSRLKSMGIQRILLEGGGTLNWSMLSERLVNEVSVAISPRILGGVNAETLVEGHGVASTANAIRLRLVSVRRYGADTVLRYEVLN